MRYLKILIIGLLLVAPGLAAAKSADIPGSAVWYFHIDLAQMRDEGPGQTVYSWLQDEAFSEVKEESGVDLDIELDSLTAFSLDGEGPVVLFEGKISQDTKDKIMAFVATGGDLEPKKASGNEERNTLLRVQLRLLLLRQMRLYLLLPFDKKQ